ncbi:GntR family transcriptional regulator [Mesorhizobium sp. B4-1-4]|uniref:GntR family transcriptional regulator n=1 Tax=Mesorhizobium sp. B4-1-4 TaxID=2589888 RepID=UPI0011264E03|nr:GntR family transcriptional regulator [Mesorhizobium sp. B4-1-4]UCI31922.1 GntR family transcriptional regulator [Mesorhizobium sp. B4-1-4]
MPDGGQQTNEVYVPMNVLAAAPEMSRVERSETLTEAAYGKLSMAIMEGVFLPGNKLTTRDIAFTLGVSPTPAREALLRLVADAVVEMPNARTMKIPHLMPARLEEITRIRICLEGMAAELAGPSLTKQDLGELEMLQLRINEAYDQRDYREILANNRSFHFLIYNKAQAPILLSMIRNCWLLIGPSLNLLYPQFMAGRTGIRNHQEAMEAIRNADAQRLRAAIQQDISDGSTVLRKAIASSL